MKINNDVVILKSTVKMPLMKLPLNSVALKTSRGVILISPGKDIAKQAAEISSLGRVTDLVAPNLLHHKSLHLAEAVFSQATVWGVEGFKTKRPDLAWDKILTEDSWNYGDEIDVIEIKGTPKLNECVFFHTASKTLVVTDLFFNLVDTKGLGAWLILKMLGTYRKFGISRFYLRAVEDKEAFKKSMKAILGLDFKTVIMSHGTPVTENAREAVTSALKERDLL